ncbi:MAG: hypothetical protein WAW96_15125 [Alphaproteobacteria bacterium]
MKRTQSNRLETLRKRVTRTIVDYEPPPTERTFLALGRTEPFLPWGGDAPTPLPLKRKPAPGDALPKADYLIITWTVAEGFALGDVLTPGYRDVRGKSKPPQGVTPWYIYRRNWDSYLSKMRHGAPARTAGRLGSYFLTKIGKAKVLCFKSELHFNRDWISGSKRTIPVGDLMYQIISEVQPKLVITTGTAGGTTAQTELGDVMVTRAAKFRLSRVFETAPFENRLLKCTAMKPIPPSTFDKARGLLLAHHDKLDPALAKRSAKIWVEGAKGNFSAFDPILTTDRFEYGTTRQGANKNYLGNAGCGVEMGDAVLGLVIDQIANPQKTPSWDLTAEAAKLRKAPLWLVIRNASDPLIDANLSKKDQINEAANIYKKYGYWTTVNSAIACWAVISTHHLKVESLRRN